MGLASSQARLLNLTARLHQIEYKASRLEAQKLQMANESTKVYEDYLEALDKTKIQYKILSTDGSVTYHDISSYADFLSAGYALNCNGVTFDGSAECYIGNVDGKCYLSEEAAKAAGNESADQRTADEDTLKEVLGITVTSSDYEQLITNIINSGEVTIVAKDTSTGTFRQGDAEDFADYETSVSTNTGLQEVTDEIALKKAEAQYEADMKKIDLKDRKFDTDLAAIENERTAITDEIDTLKSVAKDNVERTFKLFS